MAVQVKRGKKAKVLREECVACGACVNVCPIDAIIIYKGIFAEIDSAKCVGCAKCAVICPACAINMETER